MDAFTDVVTYFAVELGGLNNIFKESQVRAFGLIEAAELSWGYILAQRKFEGESKVSYELVVKDSARTEIGRFPISKHIVATAIIDDASVIGGALATLPQVVDLINKKFDPAFHSTLEKMKLARYVGVGVAVPLVQGTRL